MAIHVYTLNCEPSGARQVCMGDWRMTPARAALDFSCPSKMRNIIEIPKLRKNNEKWRYVDNYVIFLSRL